MKTDAYSHQRMIYEKIVLVRSKEALTMYLVTPVQGSR